MKPNSNSDTRHVSKVLVVDDDAGVRKFTQVVLEEAGYDTVSVPSVAEAWKHLDRREFDIVMTDIVLPDISGMELLDSVRRTAPDVPVILMTGHPSVETASEAIRSGATVDYLLKPFSRNDLLRTVQRAEEIKMIRDENRRLSAENERYQHHLEEVLEERRKQLVQAYNECRSSYSFTLEALVALLDARERSTGEHSKRVREFALILAHEMNLSATDIEDISYGTLLHDIGKIAIPDAILLKPGKLTADEWDIMKTHAQVGHDILQSSERLAGAAEIILSHHEKFDGSGYPRRLKGREICLGARIFAVVDAYDAMRSIRVYKGSVSERCALEEMLRCNGAHFDPDIVDIFLGCRTALEEIALWDELPAFSKT
ncbi:MAG TPA: HD domain-containing phosphohydrolase [Tichowtungia sp.]|nr:HD domain-containing phosphohydrolase [Tichowtungia sp.]